MNRSRILVILLALSPLHAAAQSVLPFFQSQDVVFKPELLGKWKIEETVALEFRDAGDRTYGFIMTFGDDEAQMIGRAHLIYLGGKHFLDVQLVDLRVKDKKDASLDDRKISFDPKSEDNFPWLTRSHGLILLTFSSNPNEFTGTLWNDDWLPKMAEQKKLKIPYLKDEAGRILLTAESAQLREFVANLPNEAFNSQSGTLTRDPAEPPKVTK